MRQKKHKSVKDGGKNLGGKKTFIRSQASNCGKILKSSIMCNSLYVKGGLSFWILLPWKIQLAFTIYPLPCTATERLLNVWPLILWPLKHSLFKIMLKDLQSSTAAISGDNINHLRSGVLRLIKMKWITIWKMQLFLRALFC